MKKIARVFTLIELMVTVAVIASLLMIAAPSFKQLIAQQRLKNINAELVTSLQFARSEALARNTPIYLKFGSSASPPMTCYILYTSQSAGCDCKIANITFAGWFKYFI
jgi:prepilin-type N-terminal cleavage/methylation domain-containing protein